MSETNYERYFSTPERALEWVYGNFDCCECPAYSAECYSPNRGLCIEIIRKWLEREAE